MKLTLTELLEEKGYLANFARTEGAKDKKPRSKARQKLDEAGSYLADRGRMARSKVIDLGVSQGVADAKYRGSKAYKAANQYRKRKTQEGKEYGKSLVQRYGNLGTAANVLGGGSLAALLGGGIQQGVRKGSKLMADRNVSKIGKAYMPGARNDVTKLGKNASKLYALSEKIGSGKRAAIAGAGLGTLALAAKGTSMYRNRKRKTEE